MAATPPERLLDTSTGLNVAWRRLAAVTEKRVQRGICLMPALAPYIPNRDANLNNWLANFSTLISANPFTYGLVTADAATIAAAVATWTAAYMLVTSNTTKTQQTVSAKNTARVTVLSVVRPYAQSISLNAGVASADKIALGLNPRTSTPSPISPPTTNPVLLLQNLTNLSATLRFRDSAASVSVKAKPYGVKLLRLYGATSATPLTDPTKLPLLDTFTKSPLVLSLTGLTVGQQMYCAAQWQVQSGGLSPFSPILSFTVAGSA
jgi:hypothetical protein